MIELSRHIESLLLVHNCVIVPNLGGFVAQNCPARYVKEEQLFLPPYRNIAFNPSLQMNDGLLAQSYMQAHGTDYTQRDSITIPAGKNAMFYKHQPELKFYSTRGRTEWYRPTLSFGRRTL